MHTSALATPLEADDSSKRFIISMFLEESGRLFVRSCEIIGTRFRNRTSFGESATPETAFSTKMAEEVRNCISGLSKNSEVLVLPDHTIELPNLALASPRIVTTRTPDGSLNIIMRFKSFLGSLNSAFRDDIGLTFELADQSAGLAAKVLGDIAAPLLNICAAANSNKADVNEKLGEFGNSIAGKSHEIKFQVELLNRFVDQQSRKSHQQLSTTPNLADQRYDASRLERSRATEIDGSLVFGKCVSIFPSSESAGQRHPKLTIVSS